MYVRVQSCLHAKVLSDGDANVFYPAYIVYAPVGRMAKPPSGTATLLFVIFPRQGAFDRFLPAAVTVITLGGFNTRAEFTFNDRFFL